MAGMDDVTVIGDWTPNPSPRTFMSNFLNEEFGSRSFSDLLAENGSEAPSQKSDKKKTVTGSKEEEGDAGIQFSGDLSFELNSFDIHKSSSRGGLTERIAARAGFNAPKLNTARIRSANMTSSSADIRSPYLTIPPGLSPTMLLDSPVFLSNSMAQPSPTTGKFYFAQSNNTKSGPAIPDEIKDDPFEDMAPEAFVFKPHLESSSLYFSSEGDKGQLNIGHQPLSNIQVSVQLEHPARAGSLESGPVNFQNQQDFNLHAGLSNSSERKDAADDVTFNQRGSDSMMGNEHSLHLDDQPDGEADPKGEFSTVATGAPAEDGYNWRKYGQKQVKGSEYPRSYYKCTHPNCQVKKKVERSLEGHITEIIYKGSHNHTKPPPNRRSAVCHLFSDSQFDGSEHPGSQAGLDGKLVANTQSGNGGHDWRSDVLEVTSSASGAAEFCDPSTSMQTQDGARIESPDAIDVSSTLSNEEVEDDRETHGSISLGGDGEGDETESKRRKLDACTVEMSAGSRAVREPRVVVQTTSEVDILDDGYRWRKYGQKVVKGNPNPRSYYKCTNPGCTVRKHVERASHDLKSVITTYEGKHNHDVPAARNSSSHANSLPSSTTGTLASQAHSLNRRPEPTQDSLMRFDGRALLGTFGLPGREPLGPVTSFDFGMPQQGFASLGIAGLSSLAPVHSFMGYRQATEAGFMIPKGEPKEEPMSESRLPMSTGASVYHQMMGRLPLGPQM